MKVVKALTVDRGLQAMLTELSKPGNSIDTPSRNGPVRRFKGPATIVWQRPMYRVSFDPIRNANPAFHLFEALWMLAGHNDTKRVGYFSSQIGQFSDDGATFHGAYGHRWVNHFGKDQIREYVIPALRANKEDRRVVLDMWDPSVDVLAGQSGGKDVPCNLGCTFDAAQQDGRLHLNVFNRSNDLVWGATGANAVQFSILLEYVASAIGVSVGHYEQISTNSHLYLELNEVSKNMLEAHTKDPNRELPYFGTLSPLRSKGDAPTPEEWQAKFDADIELLMANYTDIRDIDFQTNFFQRVVKPVIRSYNLYKADELEMALVHLEKMKQPVDWEAPWYRWHDWNIAMYEWLLRIIAKRNKKAAGTLVAETDQDFFKQVTQVWTRAKEEEGDNGLHMVTPSGLVVAETNPKRFIAFRGMTDLTMKNIEERST